MLKRTLSGKLNLVKFEFNLNENWFSIHKVVPIKVRQINLLIFLKVNTHTCFTNT